MSLNYLAKGLSGRAAVNGEVRVPGDKSISHRAIMFGSLADGVTEVSGFLNGEDCLSTQRAFEAMGVEVETLSATALSVHGVGIDGLKQPSAALNLGNSGTSMRLMSGLLAGQSFDSVLTGDASLSNRPMRRVTDPLSTMGAEIGTTESGTAPLHVKGARRLQGISYDSPVASAQVKSSILLAGLYAEGKTVVTEPGLSRDHTERMLQGFGYEVEARPQYAALSGGGRLTAANINVPADISSAAFMLVAASISPGSDLTLHNVGMNPTRTGVVDILRLMGADIQAHNERIEGGEPVADLQVRYSGLKGIHVPEELVPLAIDEFPVLFVAASFAEGDTVVSGAEELRVKESDRIQVMADGLQAMGIDAQPQEDGMIIRGQSQKVPAEAVAIDAQHDHRIAMSFVVASLASQCDVTVQGCETVNTSFPGFFPLMSRLGAELSER
ncbi:MAG: 3-phosphoshikimate 1-carboxyvinyltransferase [Gammaproteobacteria bacterium]|nr:3-phosphoshikimate 1-carboxyvinyltransferase [Gammaproteobacteria bacterium]